MTDREALLRAVCENPDDDLPRLVFADWCEENGEPERAEFIRLQVDRGRPDGYPVRAALGTREEELLSSNGDRWLAQLPTETGWHWGHFIRGFVDGLHVATNAEPWSDPSRVFSCAPLTELCLFGQPIGPWVPHLRHIRSLSLIGCPVTDAEATALCAAGIGSRFEKLLVVDPSGFDPIVMDRLTRRFGPALEFPG